MQKWIWGVIAVGLLIVLFVSGTTLKNRTTNGDLVPRFPDFGHMVDPSLYQGRVFKLSSHYPQDLPPVDKETYRILTIDFKKDWKAYANAVRDYIFAGNIGHGDYSNDFYLEDNAIRRWHHVPWQHWGPYGREGFHGLTKEGPLAPGVLAPQQKELRQTYAVGFYNDRGGYLIGQVWKNPKNPDLTSLKKGGFPEGTIVGKILFTTATEDEVPYLKNPIEWQAYATTSFPSQDRKIQTVRLLQMDILVRDSRAKSGWVFGTFVYNGTLNHKNRWYNLVPVGIMWGNDPTVKTNLTNATPTQTRTNPALKETIINHSSDMPPMHLGWGLRLNGPADNPRSSCMSCHSTAQYPPISSILPFFNVPPVNDAGSPAWMRWFRNVPCAVAFDPEAISTDYSLQLAQSIQNVMEWKSQNVGGFYSVQFWSHDKPVHKIVRNK